jgi:hypothetical protein
MPGLVPGIHVFSSKAETWMAGTSPAMTKVSECSPDERSDIRDIRIWHASRISRSLSSGAHARDPLAHAGYLLSFHL